MIRISGELTVRTPVTVQEEEQVEAQVREDFSAHLARMLHLRAVHDERTGRSTYFMDLIAVPQDEQIRLQALADRLGRRDRQQLTRDEREILDLLSPNMPAM